jgi:hypothetical protein
MQIKKDEKYFQNNVKVVQATGKDGISVNILKIAKPIVSKPITMLINKTIENASFPNKLRDTGCTSP